MIQNSLLILAILAIQTSAWGEVKRYQTQERISVPAPQETQVPLVELDGRGNLKSIYVQPQALAPFESRLVTASLADEEPTAAQIHQAQALLYQQMMQACPLGWIKTGEQARKMNNDWQLLVHFACQP